LSSTLPNTRRLNNTYRQYRTRSLVSTHRDIFHGEIIMTETNANTFHNDYPTVQRGRRGLWTTLRSDEDRPLTCSRVRRVWIVCVRMDKVTDLLFSVRSGRAASQRRYWELNFSCIFYRASSTYC